MNTNLITSAHACLAAGLSVIPTCTDKRPACAWKKHTAVKMTAQEANRLFAKAGGIGIVTGRVSGNLEILDFDDGGSRFEPWMKSLPPYLRDRLVIERTPSGGRHVFYRVAPNADSRAQVIPGNRKLAMKKEGHVLIETRGEGGYVKCAPSNGYSLIQGDFAHIPELSAFEHEHIIELARRLDEMKNEKLETPPFPVSRFPFPDDLRSALIAAGWKVVRRDGENEHWERPGKNERATSATFNGSVFYVFSSNAYPFEPNRGYSVRSALRLIKNEELGGRCHGSGVRCQLENSPSDPGPLPEELLSCPGFIDELIAYTLATAPYPNRTLAFAGALAFLALLASRRVKDSMGTRPNVYLLSLASSGSGKQHPRSVNARLAHLKGFSHMLGDYFASGEGLEDAFAYSSPAMLFQIDEADSLFGSVKAMDPKSEMINSMLLRLYSESSGVHIMRKKAVQREGKRAASSQGKNSILEPHLTLLGTAVPKFLYSSLSERVMSNGLIARCLILDAGERGEANKKLEELEVPQSLLDCIDFFLSIARDQETDGDSLAGCYTIELTAEAKSRIDAMRESADAEYKRHESSRDESALALWARAAEKAMKLALLRAISRDFAEPVITPEDVDWARELVFHATRRMLYLASLYVFDGEFDALRQKVRQKILEKGHGKLSYRDLLRSMHIDREDLGKVLDTMQVCEEIFVEEGSKGGKILVLADA